MKPANWVPPWLDRQALAAHICCSDRTVRNWVAKGILPPPRKMGRKLMWKWSEVEEWLTMGKPKPSAGRDRAQEIRDATRRALKELSAR